MSPDQLEYHLMQQSKEIAATHTLVKDMHDRMFTKDGIEDRVDSLEATRDQGKGVAWLLSSVVALVGGAELIHWFQGK